MKSIYIEITNVCNLQCSFCPSASPALDIQRGFISRDLFRKILANAKEIVDSVYFHVLGEPTLHPDFLNFLKDLESTTLALNLTTNGTTIEKTGPFILACPSVRQVNFSTHAYAELERSKAENHLSHILDFCKQALEARPELYINLRLWNVGDNTSESWNEFLLQEVNRLFETNISLGHFCSKHKSFLIKGRLYLHQDSRFQWPGSEPQIQTKGTCRALDTHAAILHDGRVVACCLDYSGQIQLGRIQDSSLAEILESPKAQNIREGFSHHELRHPFCQRCSFCKRFK